VYSLTVRFVRLVLFSSLQAGCMCVCEVLGVRVFFSFCPLYVHCHKVPTLCINKHGHWCSCVSSFRLWLHPAAPLPGPAYPVLYLYCLPEIQLVMCAAWPAKSVVNSKHEHTPFPQICQEHLPHAPLQSSIRAVWLLKKSPGQLAKPSSTDASEDTSMSVATTDSSVASTGASKISGDGGEHKGKEQGRSGLNEVEGVNSHAGAEGSRKEGTKSQREQ
jgi:hypothetical protein